MAKYDTKELNATIDDILNTTVEDILTDGQNKSQAQPNVATQTQPKAMGQGKSKAAAAGNDIENESQEVVLHKEKMDFRQEEAYKTLRANIEFVGEDVQVIAVTSCIPGEGKSSVAMNLSMALAESGHKVLVIDADLRKSVLVSRYKTGRIRYGLTHYLSSGKHRSEITFHSDVHNLDIIFSGPVPPNPSELLGGKRFREMVGQLRSQYDYIIIDTPPLGSVIDSAVVSKVCDGTVLVIAAHTISYRMAQRVKSQLVTADCRILGCVLNKVELRKGSYYGKYYGKYYGNYDSDKL